MATETLRGGVARQAKPAASLWSDAFARLRKNKLSMIGLVMVIFLLFLAIVGPFITPYNYQDQDLVAVVANHGQPLPPCPLVCARAGATVPTPRVSQSFATWRAP